MEMMNGFASCLIKVRQFDIGFPSLFSHYPEGMKHEELTEIHGYVQNAMDQPPLIPEAGGSIRRVIIGTGKYLIMGIAGYAQHLAADVPDIPYQLVDFTGRKCPGFIGFVWNLETTPVQPIAFPSLSAFGAAFQELILTHWKDSKNSEWAYDTRAGVEVPYRYPVSGELLPMPGEPAALNHDKRKLYSFDRSKENSLIYQAIAEAVGKKGVSLCTDLYFDSEKGSSFWNMTADLKDGPMVRLENPKFTRIKITSKPEPEAEKEQYRTSTEANRGCAAGSDNFGTSRDHNTNTGFSTPTIPPVEEKSVFLKFQYTPCEKAQWLEEKFLAQLVAFCRNCGYPVYYVESFVQSNSRWLTVRVHKFSISSPILLEDFRKICERIYQQIWVDISQVKQYIVQYLGEVADFDVFVVENLFCGNASWIKAKKIRPDVSGPDARRSGTPKKPVSRKNKKEKTDPDPQVSTSGNPLIQTIKQSNQEKQEKKPSEDNDLFKM